MATDKHTAKLHSMSLLALILQKRMHQKRIALIDAEVERRRAEDKKGAL
jgi:predicted kinase